MNGAGIVNSLKTAQHYANQLRADMLRQSMFLERFPAKPLTRQQRIMARMDNYRDRLRRAWRVLRYDEELEGEDGY